MRLLISGGGTGGHLYPGVAVAEAAQARFPGTPVLFIGGRRLEARILPEAGWAFETVVARPLPRRPGVALVSALTVNGVGTLQAIGRLRRWHPDVVLGTGGYVSGPVGLAAALLGIPLVLQEQNALPGLANFWLARWARAISVPAPMAGFPADRVVVTGVPVRPSTLRGSREEGRRSFGLDPERFTILVLGGSQGALSLNRAVCEAATLMMYEPLQILHQTGREHLEWVRREIGHREHVGPPVIRQVVRPFIDHVGDAYAAADVVLCRAGASTLAELTAWGLPALLVPYPHAAGAHQDANARLLTAAGAATAIPDAELSGLRLAEEIGALVRDADRRRAMAEASRRMARPDAAERVLDLLVGAAEGRPLPPGNEDAPTPSPGLTTRHLGAAGFSRWRM